VGSVPAVDIGVLPAFPVKARGPASRPLAPLLTVLEVLPVLLDEWRHFSGTVLSGKIACTGQAASQPCTVDALVGMDVTDPRPRRCS